MGRENGVATDDPLPVVLGGCAVIWIVSYLFLRDEEKKKIIINHQLHAISLYDGFYDERPTYLAE